MMSATEVDGAVIARSVREPELFGTIYDRHAPALAAYLGRRLAPEAVEGLLADVFVAAFEGRQRFDETSDSALPWLYGIARNLVRRHHRSADRERRATGRVASLRVVEAASARGLDDLVGASTDNASTLTAVQRFIDDQSAIDREVLLLYAWEELSYGQIADAVDIPVGTVKSKLNRMRRLLRRLNHD